MHKKTESNKKKKNRAQFQDLNGDGLNDCMFSNHDYSKYVRVFFFILDSSLKKLLISCFSKSKIGPEY